jgi:hypothetical protein
LRDLYDFAKRQKLRRRGGAQNAGAEPRGCGRYRALDWRNRENQLDSDLGDVEIGFEDDSLGQGDSELLLNPAPVLGYSPAQQVRPDGKLIYDAGRGYPHITLCPVE